MHQKKESEDLTMSNKTTQNNIEEYLNNKAEIDRLTERNNELRLMLIKDTDKFGTPDTKNENKVVWKREKFTLIVNHIKGEKFNQSRFRDEQTALYNAYKDSYTEDRLTAKENK